jgi:hypothetical protein
MSKRLISPRSATFSAKIILPCGFVSNRLPGYHTCSLMYCDSRRASGATWGDLNIFHILGVLTVMLIFKAYRAGFNPTPCQRKRN